MIYTPVSITHTVPRIPSFLARQTVVDVYRHKLALIYAYRLSEMRKHGDSSLSLRLSEIRYCTHSNNFGATDLDITVLKQPWHDAYTWLSSSSDARDKDHTGKCTRRFGGIYAYCRYFIDREW